MKRKISMVFLIVMLVLPCFSMVQTTLDKDTISTTTKVDKKVKTTDDSGIDWLQVTMVGSILIGLFALFPIVIYTNLNEKLVDVEKYPEKLRLLNEPLNNRELRAIEILEEIDKSLTPYVDDNNQEMITITKGKQARLMKRGLDFINIYLAPKEEDILDRVAEFTMVYNERTERIYSGSKWILGCAIGLLIFMGVVDTSILLSGFTLIHVAGIVFYYMACKVPKYILDKRIERFGENRKGLVGFVISALFAGVAVKHYVSINGGPWERDHESEFSSSMVFILFALIAALFIGFFIALFGIFNFLINYLTNFILPFPSNEKWYEKTFEKQLG